MSHHRHQSFPQSPLGLPPPELDPHQFVLPENVAARQVPDVPEPEKRTPTDDEVFKDDGPGRRKPNASFLRGHFFREGRLTEDQAMYILERATEMLSMEENMVHVKSPVTICGDIHGQYYDLMKLFEVGGNLNENSYLFLGDYVDRGCFGIECLLYLYSLKLCYPTKFTFLRGNHECKHLTEYFTFRMECLRKYSMRVYDACVRSFCALPLVALVDKRFFCVHGGISPELIKLEDLNRINRFQEPGSAGLLCDLLWADPIQGFGEEGEPREHFLHNANRGCSFFYTYAAVCQFLERNNLMGVIRGHEAQDAGYQMHRKTPTKKFPSVITIFSAPNYLDIYRNRGAVIKYANKNITIRQYNSSVHPYWLPNFMDAFTWSLPFVGAKIVDMLLSILAICSQEELNDVTDAEEQLRRESEILMSPTDLQRRRQEIKGKILAVAKMQQMFTKLREDAENATELGPDEPAGGSESKDHLGIQSNMIRRNVRSFGEARAMDMLNERLPNPGEIPAMPGGFVPPSMKRRGSGDSEIEISPENTAERLVEKLVGGPERRGSLKRYGTA